MFELIVVVGVIVAAFVVALRQKQPTSKEVKVPPKVSRQLKELWTSAQGSMNKRRYLTAEKALLKILKIDHKNAAAYNRLGILYVRQKKYDDAIDCFEIASSIAPSPSNLHNLGLVYMDTKRFEKAAVAFERSVDLEPTLGRFMALAKAHLALNNHKKVVDILERAAEEHDDEKPLQMLVESYEYLGNELGAEETRERLKNLRSKQRSQKSQQKTAKQKPKQSRRQQAKTI